MHQRRHRCGLTKPGPQAPSLVVGMRVRSRTISRSHAGWQLAGPRKPAGACGRSSARVAVSSLSAHLIDHRRRRRRPSILHLRANLTAIGDDGRRGP
jgi:hypothetical protein